MLTAGRLIEQQVFAAKLGIGRNPGISSCPRVSDGRSMSLKSAVGVGGIDWGTVIVHSHLREGSGQAGAIWRTSCI